MKSLPSLVAITFVVLFLATSSLAQPLDLKQRTQALALILETAKEICTETPLDQSNQEVQLSVEAKAKLSGLIKNFTSAGLSGGAKYTTNSSRGVLQKDLARSIESNNNCKLAVLNLLSEKFLPEAVNREVSLASRSKAPPNAKSQALGVPISFNMPTGTFTKRGSVWVEEQPDLAVQIFTFYELNRDKEYLYLVDYSRQKPGESNNPILARLPLRGGNAQWSWQNPVIWNDFSVVTPIY